MGITSYSFDYRGFGKSSGWPSEKGIERDSDAFWRYVIEREQVDSSRIIVLGYSVGGAPAARIASLHHHTERLKNAYAGDGRAQRITSPTSGHNDLFFTIRQELADTMMSCL